MGMVSESQATVRRSEQVFPLFFVVVCYYFAVELLGTRLLAQRPKRANPQWPQWPQWLKFSDIHSII